MPELKIGDIVRLKVMPTTFDGPCYVEHMQAMARAGVKFKVTSIITDYNPTRYRIEPVDSGPYGSCKVWASWVYIVKPDKKRKLNQKLKRRY